MQLSNCGMPSFFHCLDKQLCRLAFTAPQPYYSVLPSSTSPVLLYPTHYASEVIRNTLQETEDQSDDDWADKMLSLGNHSQILTENTSFLPCCKTGDNCIIFQPILVTFHTKTVFQKCPSNIHAQQNSIKIQPCQQPRFLLSKTGKDGGNENRTCLEIF